MPTCPQRITPLSGCPAARPRLAGLGVIAAWAWRCAERARQRRALARLDDRLLRDVGLSRADMRSETTRAFWRL
jgi:uncharacterized protein YjiS (DUF1127 family)